MVHLSILLVCICTLSLDINCLNTLLNNFLCAFLHLSMSINALLVWSLFDIICLSTLLNSFLCVSLLILALLFSMCTLLIDIKLLILASINFLCIFLILSDITTGLVLHISLLLFIILLICIFKKLIKLVGLLVTF